MARLFYVENNMRSKPCSFHQLKTLYLLLVISLSAAPALFARPIPERVQTPQSQARPFPPAQYTPSHDYDTWNVTLKLRFDWEHEQAIGSAVITLAPLVKDLRQVDFDATNMTFTAVKLSSGTVLTYETDADKEKLRVKLDRDYQPSEQLTLIIDYHTNGPQSRRLSLAGGGLRFIKPTADDPTRPRQVWSQGESEYNHYWFPCFDHPNDFFTSELYATVEKPLSVISNGKLIETKDNGDGTLTFHWKIDQPHASYLSSIIVGEFTPIVQDYAGIPVITNVYPNEVAEGRVTAARLTEMVKFFSEKTGVKYPYAKYAQTTVRDFGGGMENISATTQTDNMIHDARTELDQTSDGLQSHELAHQWFGDYVTCRSWSDIWLNESFATYFQALWDEHNLGHDDFLYLDVKGNQDQYYNAWKQGNRRPIVTKNYANPDAVFDTYAYPRGGAVLHMLRTYLGEDNWWHAINHYLRKYANQPVETEQFRIAIEEATGQSMDWFFDEWLYRMGHPVFQITKGYDPAAKQLTVTVKQVQKPDPNSQYPQVKLFQTPVYIEIVTASAARVERAQIEPKEEQTFTFTADSQPLLVNFDYQNTLIKEVEFNKPTDELIYQLAHDQDVMGRMWALSQLTSRMQNETTPAPEGEQITTQLADTLIHDKFWGMRLESAGSLGRGGDKGRAALILATKDQNARVRARAITSLAASKDPALATVYQQFLNDQSYAVIRAAAIALGQTKDPGAYEALLKLLDMPSWRDNIKASGLSGLASLGDKRALDLGFRYASKGNRAPLRSAAFRIIGAGGKDDPRAFGLISEALNDAVEKRDFGLASAAADALVTLGDARGLAVFDDLMKKTTDGQIRGFLSQFQERLRRSAQGPANTPSRP
jgi:aminopeptidase N